MDIIWKKIALENFRRRLGTEGYFQVEPPEVENVNKFANLKNNFFSDLIRFRLEFYKIENE